MSSSPIRRTRTALRPGQLDPSELERFAHLLARGESRGPQGLPFEELRELALANRRATAALARLRDRDRDPEAVHYLNSLCVRAHSLLTVPPPRRRAPLLPRFRAALGRSWPALCVAWVLLGIGVYVGAAVVAKEPKAAYAMLPSSLGYTPARLDRLLGSADDRAAFLAPGTTAVETNLLFGSQLFANNTRVGMFAMATGILAGVPTLLLTIYNGAILGAFGAVFWSPPHRIEFLAWLLPHGIPEFTAIVLCSAAGLLLGAPLVGGDRRGRTAAWRDATQSALLLFSLSVPLFVAAAIIESFVRESALGTTVRLVVAAAMGILVLWLFLAAGRVRRRPVSVGWLDQTGATPRIAGPGSGSALRR